MKLLCLLARSYCSLSTLNAFILSRSRAVDERIKDPSGNDKKNPVKLTKKGGDEKVILSSVFVKTTQKHPTSNMLYDYFLFKIFFSAFGCLCLIFILAFEIKFKYRVLKKVIFFRAPPQYLSLNM